MCYKWLLYNLVDNKHIEKRVILIQPWVKSKCSLAQPIDEFVKGDACCCFFIQGTCMSFLWTTILDCSSNWSISNLSEMLLLTPKAAKLTTTACHGLKVDLMQFIRLNQLFLFNDLIGSTLKYSILLYLKVEYLKTFKKMEWYRVIPTQYEHFKSGMKIRWTFVEGVGSQNL